MRNAKDEFEEELKREACSFLEAEMVERRKERMSNTGKEWVDMDRHDRIVKNKKSVATCSFLEEEACSFLEADSFLEGSEEVGQVRWCTKAEFRRGLLKKFPAEDAERLMRLFFSQWEGAGLVNQIRYYRFVCDKGEAEAFERNIRMLVELHGLKRGFERYFSVEKRGGKIAFVTNKAAYVHVFLLPQIFAVLRLNLRYKRRTDRCFGAAFNPAHAISPETNLYHPDRMTHEQIARWSE